MNDARRRPRDSRTDGIVRRDTIVAVATARGRSAIGIVRISGPEVERIGRAVVAPWPRAGRRMTRCTVRDPRTGEVLDDALAVLFPGPASYTGESVLEIHAHGGMYVPQAIEAALVAAGARPALPGEFTERAFLRGKLDLIRAEAVREVIDARTQAAHRVAMAALSGALTHQYEALRDGVLAVEALIAFDIDFPEEDHGPVARDAVEAAARTLEGRLRDATGGALAQRCAREGATVVLAGLPNAGKSSLLNALVGEARAIVSDMPGTTRDAIEVFVDGDPWPLRYVDTAGLRDGTDVVERLGIEVSERYLRQADVVVVCAEHDEDAAIEARIRKLTHAELVVARTKADLAMPASAGPPSAGPPSAGPPSAGPPSAGPARARGAVAVSSVTGLGVGELRQRVMDAVTARSGGAVNAAKAINARQQAALEAALRDVSAFIECWRAADLPTPVAGTHLRAAVDALEELVGAIDTEDVLTRVFSTFCVGK